MQGVTESTMDYTPIHQAVSVLAGVCDWAGSWDGTGYNKADTVFGHTAAGIPVEQWDDTMAYALHAMLRKYKNQLKASFDIVWEDLPVPPKPEALEDAKAREQARDRIAGIRDAERRRKQSWVRCDGEGERCCVAFPYNPGLVAELKAWPRSDGRHYNHPGDSRNKFPDYSNDFPFAALPKVVDFADKHGIDVPAEVRALVTVARTAAEGTGKLSREVGANVYLDKDGRLCVAADFHKALNAALKDMNTGMSTWDADRNVHVVPAHSPVRFRSILNKFELTLADDARVVIEAEAARQAVNRHFATQATIDVPMAAFPGLAPDQQVKAPQWPAIHFALTHKRVILGDEMGFGKTLQALATLSAAGAFPAVVVCRPSLVDNWADEIDKFFPFLNVYCAEGQEAKVVPADTDIIVIGSNNLGYTPPVPTWTSGDEDKARKAPLEMVKADRARRAIAYLLTQPGQTSETIAAAANRAVRNIRSYPGKFRLTPAMLAALGPVTAALLVTAARWKEGQTVQTVTAIADGERTRMQRQMEAGLVKAARDASGRYGAVKQFGWVDAVNRLNPQALIIDEGQDVKEASANRTQAVALVAGPIVTADGYVLNLTGTALLNYVRELAEQLEIMGLIHLFGGKKKFLWRYCVDPEEKQKYHEYGPKYTGRDHLEELHARLLEWGIMVRRTDPAILGIPSFRPETIDVDPAALDAKVMAEYQAAERNVVAFLAQQRRELIERLTEEMGEEPPEEAVREAWNSGGAEHLVLLNTLRTLIGKAKRPVAMAWIRDQLAVGEKVVVAADRREEVGAYAKAFGGLRLQGGQSSSDKSDHKRRFQTDPAAMVISIAIKAGGTGHTLHAGGACNRLLQVELTWGPGDEDQLAKRIHRIGQTRPCVGYRLVALQDADGNPLIDGYLADMVASKRVTLNAVLNGQFEGLDEAAEKKIAESVASEIAWAYAERAFSNVGGRA